MCQERNFVSPEISAGGWLLAVCMLFVVRLVAVQVKMFVLLARLFAWSPFWPGRSPYRLFGRNISVERCCQPPRYQPPSATARCYGPNTPDHRLRHTDDARRRADHRKLTVKFPYFVGVTGRQRPMDGSVRIAGRPILNVHS